MQNARMVLERGSSWAILVRKLVSVFILIRPLWPECHKMAIVRRVAAETQQAPGK